MLVQLFKVAFEEPGSPSSTPSFGHGCHSHGKVAPSALGMEKSKGEEWGRQKAKC